MLFSTFNCRQVGEDSSVLVEDDQVLCESDEHGSYQSASVVGIVVFAIGLPCVLFFVLWTRRREDADHLNVNRELVQRVAKALDETKDEDGEEPKPLSETRANILVRDVSSQAIRKLLVITGSFLTECLWL